MNNVGNIDTMDKDAGSILRNTQTVIKFYSKFGTFLKLTGEERSRLRELQGRAALLDEDYLDLVRDFLRDYARGRFAGTGMEDRINEDTFESIKGINAAASYFLDASRVGRTELSVLDMAVRDAEELARAEYLGRMSEYDSLSEEFKKTEYFKKYGWDGLVELDAQGNPEPRIISAVSGNWYRAEEEQRRLAVATRKNQGEGYPRYYKWLKENTMTVDPASLFDFTTRDVKRKADPVIMRQLEKEYGKEATEEFLQRQELLLRRYVDDRTAAFDVIDMKFPDEAVRKRKKAEWEGNFSP